MIRLINKYEIILSVLCEYKGITRKELVELLKDKKFKYLLFLFLKKYKCFNFEKLRQDFLIQNRKIIRYNCKKAEEKFFINKEFRELYFEMEADINKII